MAYLIGEEVEAACGGAKASSIPPQAAEESPSDAACALACWFASRLVWHRPLSCKDHEDKKERVLAPLFERARSSEGLAARVGVLLDKCAAAVEWGRGQPEQTVKRNLKHVLRKRDLGSLSSLEAALQAHAAGSAAHKAS
jgi:hypothetical protein